MSAVRYGAWVEANHKPVEPSECRRLVTGHGQPKQTHIISHAIDSLQNNLQHVQAPMAKAGRRGALSSATKQ